jgi:hypothetical protein
VESSLSKRAIHTPNLKRKRSHSFVRNRLKNVRWKLHQYSILIYSFNLSDSKMVSPPLPSILPFSDTSLTSISLPIESALSSVPTSLSDDSVIPHDPPSNPSTEHWHETEVVCLDFPHLPRVVVTRSSQSWILRESTEEDDSGIGHLTTLFVSLINYY